jgi:hypothetical protein
MVYRKIKSCTSERNADLMEITVGNITSFCLNVFTSALNNISSQALEN